MGCDLVCVCLLCFAFLLRVFFDDDGMLRVMELLGGKYACYDGHVADVYYESS